MNSAVRWLVLIAALAVAPLAGCNDPSISIAFDVPARYRGDVVKTVIEVFEVPDDDLVAFDCDDIAVADVPADSLEVAMVSREEFGKDGEGVLPSIPRVGTKLVLARGLDALDLPVTAGCAPLGTVTDDIAIAIPGEPAPLLAIEDLPFGNELPSSGLGVQVTDIHVRPLPAFDVAWRVTGPGGETSLGSVATDANGAATVVPAAPALPGPAALDVRVRWQRTTPETIVGFVEPPTVLTGSVPGVADSEARSNTEFVVGRVGPAGELGFAGLGLPESTVSTERRVVIAYFDPTAPSGSFRVSESAPITGAQALGLLRGTTRDEVFTITRLEWISIASDGTLAAVTSPRPGVAARRIMSVGPCDGSGPDVALVWFGDDIAAFTGPTTPVANQFVAALNAQTSVRPLAAGCVAGVGASPHRTLVATTPAAESFVVASVDGALRATSWPTPLAFSVGFSRAVGTELGLLLSADIDLDGVVIGRSRLQPTGASGLDLELVKEDPAPTIARSTAGGDVDNDGLSDVVATVDFGTNDDREAQFRLLIALGAEQNGERIVGLSRLAVGADPRVFLADFDGDGADDILLATLNQYSVFDMTPGQP